ncbi:hypothetical protein JMUB3935_1406 [Leptotrichia trevisanii]|uniref:DUF5362 domain-containing protein n=1 Tax=Leptotrichia trevisanii TaxID=109328 RepID=A0A510KMA1_9FUSO|nr:DUF5362 domain-containing protein [Leptotrichia trevisanii]BBM52427.1 hypothetical protein JMUB3935_1406 [Leptotrichia trevisanii]
MDLDNNKNETDFLNEEKNNENNQSEHHFNNLEKLNEIRNEVTNNFNDKKEGSNSFQTAVNTVTESITLTLDPVTIKNMKFIATVLKIFSILGMISGVLQSLMFFFIIPLVTGIFTIVIALKFSKSASFLEEAVLMNDENKLKSYFNEQAKALKLYIIFIIVSIVLTIIYCVFIFSIVLTGVLNHPDYSRYSY